MDNNRTVLWAIPLTIIGALLLLWSGNVETWGRDVLLVIGLVLIAAAASIVLVWFLWHWAELKRFNWETEAITPELRLTEAKAKLAAEVRNLTADGQNVLAKQAGILTPDFDLFEEEPHIGGVPWWFWAEFIKATTHDSGTFFLCPIGRYSSGSERQTWAKMVTAYLVTKQLAVEFKRDSQWEGGNRPARWLSYDAYKRVYQYVMETTDEPKYTPSPTE